MSCPQRNPEYSDKRLLTSIHQAYTVGDTPEPDSNERESLIVKNFLDTLADVSLSIASRNSKKDGESQS